MKMMKFILYILIPALVKAAPYPDDGCTSMDGGTQVVCRNYQQDYFPLQAEYEYAFNMSVSGNFSKFAPSPRYATLMYLTIASSNLKELDFTAYANLTNIRGLYVLDSNMTSLDFTGLDSLYNLVEFAVLNRQPVEIRSCMTLHNIPFLTGLTLNPTVLDGSCIPHGLYYLTLTNMTGLRSPRFLKDVTDLKILNLSYNKMTSFNFTNVPDGIVMIDLSGNMLSRFDGMESMSTYTQMWFVNLEGNRLPSFGFEHLPNSTEVLLLKENKLSSISEASCHYLQAHRRLRTVDLSWNRLKRRLSLSCFPKARTYVNLSNNKINKISVRGFKRFSTVKFNIANNPICCTCSFLLDFMVHNSNFVCPVEGACITCRKGTPLANYPWTMEISQLVKHDTSSKHCISH